MIKLGARVTAPGRIIKSREGDKREWYKPSWRQKPVEGVYMGCRTYSNGTTTIDEDGGRNFHPEEYLKIGLIVTSTRTNPIPVLYDDISVMDDTEISGRHSEQWRALHMVPRPRALGD